MFAVSKNLPNNSTRCITIIPFRFEWFWKKKKKTYVEHILKNTFCMPLLIRSLFALNIILSLFLLCSFTFPYDWQRCLYGHCSVNGAKTLEHYMQTGFHSTHKGYSFKIIWRVSLGKRDMESIEYRKIKNYVNDGERKKIPL